MRRLSRDLAHALAAEYVLGTLRGAARRRFEAIARTDAEAAKALRAWEDAMTPLAERIAPVEPPARVWRAIESRIAPASQGGGLWSSLAFWRNLALGSSGLAAVLLAAILTLGRPAPHEPMMVAVLSEDAVPRAVASLDAPGVLRVRIVKPWSHMENQSLELWAMPKAGGAPRSLGLVDISDRETVIRLAPEQSRLHDVKALAVSMEPMGGSPTRQPTGTLVCAGPLVPMRRT